jgi:hypothetical protein
MLAVLAFGSVSFAQEIDKEALKAELRAELKAELKQELMTELKSETKASVQEATLGLRDVMKADFAEEIRSEIMQENISGAVEEALAGSAIMGGMFNGATVGGFIDTNFMYNLRNHGEGRAGAQGAGTVNNAYQNSSNALNFLGENDEGFVLENFAMFLDKGATDDHPVGWQMHTYWGEKAKAMTFLGEDNDVNDDIRMAVTTANVTWNAPVGGVTVPITMGKMYTWIGYELVENIGNPNYTHGSAYNNAIPFTHMGLSFDVSEFLPSDKFGLSLYFVNGWDSYIDGNEGKSFGTYLTWAPNDDWFWSLATIIGPEEWAVGGPKSSESANVMMYDVVATYSLPAIEKLSLGFNWDHGYAENASMSSLAGSSAKTKGASGAHWWAAVGYAMWDFTDTQMGAFRYEYFANNDGAKDANVTYSGANQVGGGSWWTMTYTHNFTVADNLMLRPEVRYNNYSHSVRPDIIGGSLGAGDKGHTGADDEWILAFGAEYIF